MWPQPMYPWNKIAHGFLYDARKKEMNDQSGSRHDDRVWISRADSVRHATGRASLFLPVRRQQRGATISKSLNYRCGRLLSEERHLICTRKCCYKRGGKRERERTIRSLKRSSSGVACVINKGERWTSDTGARGSPFPRNDEETLLSPHPVSLDLVDEWFFSWYRNHVDHSRRA